jgi:hypothetical protein
LKAERPIIAERYTMIQYTPGGIFRGSFKFCMEDKLREKMEGGKRDDTFFIVILSTLPTAAPLKSPGISG